MAENEHQEYFQRVGGGNPYCSFVIEPKVAKFRKLFVDRLKRK
jgi:peptide-methionine (S)-S-oxide reductase